MSDDTNYEGLMLSDDEIAAMEEDVAEETAELSATENVEDDDAKQDAAEQVGEDVETEAEPEPVPQAAAAQNDEPQQEHAVAGDSLDALRAQLSDLKAKFDEGDITIEDYLDGRDSLQLSIIKAELQKDAVERAWHASRENFLQQNAYLRENDVLYGAFAMQVNAILQTPEGDRMTDEAILQAAKAKVDTAFGRKAEPSRDESPVKKAKSESADTSKVPQSLRGIPVAEAHDVEGSKFAYLDKLNGEEFEAAIMRLSDTDRDLWARSQ